MELLNFNIMGIIFGLIGSLVLAGDILTLPFDKIVNSTGDNSPFWKSTENDTKPRLSLRLKTIFGAFLIALSYLCQLATTMQLGAIGNKEWEASALVAILVTGVILGIKCWYKNKLFTASRFEKDCLRGNDLPAHQ